MAAGSIILDLLMRTGSFETDTKRAEKRVRDMGSTFDRVGKTIGNVFAGVAVGAFIRKVVDATVEQERVTKQLEATLKSTGGQAGLTRDELLSMASGLQDVTTYGDEATIAAQSLLLTFTNIGRNVFPQALEAVLNVSTAMGTDLKSAALQVGKALNDPIKGMASLAESGIQFSDAQKEMIKSLVASGQGVEAQSIILKELETQFGGSARAARDTMGGALKSLQNAFGDLLEGDGGGEGVKGATASINGLSKLMSSSEVKAAFGTITGAVIDLLGVVARGAVAFANFGKSIGEALGASIAGPDTALGRVDQEIVDLQERLGLLADDLSRVRLLRVNPFQSTAEMQQDYDNVLERLRTLRTLRDGLSEIKPSGVPSAPGAASTTPDRQFGSPPPPKHRATGAPKVSDLQRMNKAFADQAATVGLTSDQIELYRFKLAGASPSQLAFAASVQDSIKSFEAQARALSDGMRVMEDTRTPAEAYASEIERLNELRDRGAVSQEAYNRSVMEAQDVFTGTQDSVKSMRDDLERLNALLDATPTAQLEKQRQTMQLLADAFERGAISAEQFGEAASTALGNIAPAAEKATDVMEEFAKQAARNMQDSFADFLFDPFKDGLDGMLRSFGTMLQRMAAEAVAADLASRIMGPSGNGKDGWIDLAFTAVSAYFGGGVSAGSGPANISRGGSFSTSFDGGGYTGAGSRSGGVDGKGGFPAILHPNETVIDHTKGQRSSGQVINLTVNVASGTPDEVKRSAGAGARQALGAFSAAQRYA